MPGNGLYHPRGTGLPARSGASSPSKPDLPFVAGPPAIRNEATVKALDKWRGKRGGCLWCLNTQYGKKMSELPLTSPTVYEGMAVA